VEVGEKLYRPRMPRRRESVDNSVVREYRPVSVVCSASSYPK
jgi:hypothetical protein